MEQISGLLPDRRGPDRTVFAATRVLMEINGVIQKRLGFAATDATAASLRDGIVTIVVSHGAVGGRIRAAEEEILRCANEKLGLHWPAAARPVGIITRTR